MSVAGTLVRIETRKALRRFAFWVSSLSLVAILGLGFGSSFYSALRRGEVPDTLPGAWAEVVEPGPVSAIFASVVVILLVANEFTWKTARQNVIDGLSKEQFFLGKLFMVPAIAALFTGLQLGIGGLVGLAGNIQTGEFAGSLIRVVDAGIFLGFFLQVLGFVTLGFLASMLARSPGAAMGVMLLYVAILEQIIQGILSRWEATEAAVRYMPVALFSRLASPLQWDPEALAAATRRALERGRQVPEIMDAGVLVSSSVLWMTALLGVSFLVYRKRDL